MSATPLLMSELAACTALGLLVGRLTAHRRVSASLERVKLATLKATMRTVQLIVNNFFNTLLLIEMELKDSIRRSVLDELEQGMQEAFQQLKALGDLESVEEVPFATGPIIAFPRAKAAAQPATQRDYGSPPTAKVRPLSPKGIFTPH